jgi:hypothetical protein
MISTLWGNNVLRRGVAYAMAHEIDAIFCSVIGPVKSDNQLTNLSNLGFAVAPGPIAYNFISFEGKITLTITANESRILNANRYRDIVEATVDRVLYDVKM